MALALRRQLPHCELLGIDHAEPLQIAKERRMLDRGFTPSALDEALRQRPSIVILATGVETIVATIPRLVAHQRDTDDSAKLIIDVGSVKSPINATAEQLRLPRFVGGHPMSGRERGGVQRADAALLDRCRFVLCPTSSSTSADLEAARRLVELCGCIPMILAPDRHDRCAAMVSHLPHLAAWSLMAAARETSRAEGDDELPWSLAAGSWRDATRVAAADPDLWEGILQANRVEVRDALDTWMSVLATLRERLDRPQRPILEALDAKALQRLRRRIDPRLKREHE